MAFILRTIDRTAAGREIVRERRVEGDRLTIGRAATCTLHLPDLALDPVHAEIICGEDGRLTIRAAGALPFTLNGAPHHQASVLTAEGAELALGGSRITIGGTDSAAALLTVRAVEPAADGLEARRGFSLSGLLPGKRGIGWAAVALIMVVFLIVPVATHQLNQQNRKIAVTGDASWRPPALSRAHHKYEAKCETCHVEGFVSVNDSTCKSCHKDTHDHADALRLATGRPQPGLGGQFLRAVSNAFNKPGAGSCVSCHFEHQGPQPMAPPPQKLCVDCHGSLSARLTDTALGNASDFGKAHPQFRPWVVTEAVSKKMERLVLDGPLREDNGLTFPHKLHLDPLGGAARMAISLGAQRGYGAALDCKSCHRPTEDGVRFQAIRMERDCAACHSLAYDRVGTTVRRLRHGDINQALADIASVPAYGPPVPTSILSGRRRPGEFAAGGIYYNNFSAPPVGGGRAGRAFGQGGICSECHTPTAGAGRFAVVPVTLRTRFMDKARFDHRAHRQSKCTDCHVTAATSTSAKDLLLPPLKSCRTCHLGEDAPKGKVPSGCAMCHSYHPPTFTGVRTNIPGGG